MSKPGTPVRHRPARPARPARPPSGNRRARARRFPVLPFAAGAVVLLAAVAVVAGVFARGGTTRTAPPAGVAENRPVSVTGTGLPAFTSASPDPAVGQQAPEVHGAGFDGTPVAVVHDGRPKLLVFLAHWCPHCQREVPEVVDWRATGAPRGVDLVGISTSVDANRPNYPPSAWLAREGWTAPTIADDASGTVGGAFGLTGFPYFVAVDAGGRVAARASGEQTVAQLEALAQAARG